MHILIDFGLEIKMAAEFKMVAKFIDEFILKSFISKGTSNGDTIDETQPIVSEWLGFFSGYFFMYLKLPRKTVLW
jgi:hypothetical protein